MKSLRTKEIILLEAFLLLVFGVFMLQLGGNLSFTGFVVSNNTRSQVLVIETSNITCNLTLFTGWNLISTHCEPFNESVIAVTESINNSLVSVHSYEPLEELDFWKVYNPNLPNWTIQDLDNITRTKGYWINVVSNVSLEHNGTWYSPTFVSLYANYTLSGYPSNVSLDINTSIREIVDDVTAVYLYNASDVADPWKVYVPAGDPSLNDLNETVPYHGLWFQMQADRVWMVVWP